MNLIYNASSIPSALMFAALNEQDLLCRVFGDCRYGDGLDREVGDLIGTQGPGRSQAVHVRPLQRRAHDRVARPSRPGPHPAPGRASPRLDRHMGELHEVGTAVGALVRQEHFAGF